MNELFKSLNDLAASIRKECGEDITITIAECPAYGHDRISLIVNGTSHEAAAGIILNMLHNSHHPYAKHDTVTAQGWDWDRLEGTGEVTYSTITA